MYIYLAIRKRMQKSLHAFAESNILEPIKSPKNQFLEDVSKTIGSMKKVGKINYKYYKIFSVSFSKEKIYFIFFLKPFFSTEQKLKNCAVFGYSPPPPMEATLQT